MYLLELNIIGIHGESLETHELKRDKLDDILDIMNEVVDKYE